MKKIALSFLVIAGSAAYVWSAARNAPADDLLGSALPASDITTTASIPTRNVNAASGEPAVPLPPFVIRDTGAPNEPTAAPVALPPPPSLDVARASAPPPLPVPQAATGQAAAAELGPAPALRPTAMLDVPVPRLRPAYHGGTVKAAHAALTLAAGAGYGGYADGTYTGPAVDAYYGLVQIQAIVQGGRVTSLRILQYPSDRRTSVFINRQALPMLRDEVISAQSANVDIVSGATLTSEAFIQSLGGALSKAAS